MLVLMAFIEGRVVYSQYIRDGDDGSMVFIEGRVVHVYTVGILVMVMLVVIESRVVYTVGLLIGKE